ncbi:MAG: SDR family NAD(P)-dependent oxidoreductase [Gammaproteobacteria bacterium]
MQIRFDGRSIIVTGGAKGIGAAAAALLAGDGALVTVFDVDRENGEALAAATQGVTYAHVDITDRDTVGRAVEAAAAANGPVDGLVNNAGIAPPLTLEHMQPEDWNRVLQVNLTGAYNCVAAVANSMKERQYGTIVNVSSVAGKNISLGAGFHYTTSKWGLIGFSRHLAYELAPHNIRVNIVCPGPTLTTLIELDDDAKKQVACGIPLGRWVRPQDIANAIAFFLSPLSALCTGAEIVVDGGTLLGSGDNYPGYFANRGAEAPERVIGNPGDSYG